MAAVGCVLCKLCNVGSDNRHQKGILNFLDWPVPPTRENVRYYVKLEKCLIMVSNERESQDLQPSSHDWSVRHPTHV